MKMFQSGILIFCTSKWKIGTVGGSGYGEERDKIVFIKLHHSSKFEEFLAHV